MKQPCNKIIIYLPFFVDEVTVRGEMATSQDDIISSSEMLAESALVENLLLVLQLVQVLGRHLQIEPGALFESGLPLPATISRRQRVSGDLVEGKVRLLGLLGVANADHGFERRAQCPPDVD